MFQPGSRGDVICWEISGALIGLTPGITTFVLCCVFPRGDWDVDHFVVCLLIFSAPLFGILGSVGGSWWARRGSLRPDAEPTPHLSLSVLAAAEERFQAPGRAHDAAGPEEGVKREGEVRGPT
jgi:hypothetical protein